MMMIQRHSKMMVKYSRNHYQKLAKRQGIKIPNENKIYRLLLILFREEEFDEYLQTLFF